MLGLPGARQELGLGHREEGEEGAGEEAGGDGGRAEGKHCPTTLSQSSGKFKRPSTIFHWRNGHFREQGMGQTPHHRPEKTVLSTVPNNSD